MNHTATEAVETLVRGGEAVCIFTQNLYEFWVVGTRPREQNGLGMSAAEAETYCSRFEALFTLKAELPEIYAEWKNLVTQHAVIGKNAHDARIVAAMKVHSISHLLTFNIDDFKRYREITVVKPDDLIQP